MPVNADNFIQFLSKHGIRSYYGVPDSLLKELSLCLEDAGSPQNADLSSLVCANEGSAVAMAMGEYVSSGKPSCVYMQNSGLGNALNPLVSLAAREVFSVPMLLIVGWRGEPDTEDEPQHALQGIITLTLLEDMRIPYIVLDDISWTEHLSSLLAEMNNHERPVAVVVRKGFFTQSGKKPEVQIEANCTREELLESIISSMPEKDLVVATTGKCARELFELREGLGQSHDRDLLVVGGMGHAASIAYGISRNLTNQTVWCVDGDGALLMHAGALVVIAQNDVANFKYIVNRNGVHESVGGQRNAAMSLDLNTFLKGCGFEHVITARSSGEINRIMPMMRELKESAALIIETKCGSRQDLGRPTIPPLNNLRDVMASIQR